MIYEKSRKYKNEISKVPTQYIFINHRPNKLKWQLNNPIYCMLCGFKSKIQRFGVDQGTKMLDKKMLFMKISAMSWFSMLLLIQNLYSIQKKKPKQKYIKRNLTNRFELGDDTLKPINYSSHTLFAIK